MRPYRIRFMLVSVVSILVACQPASTTMTPSVPATVARENTPIVTADPAVGPDYQIRWTLQTAGPIWGPVSVRDGVVYVGSDDGNLYAVDARNGNLRWTFSTQGIIRSRPSFDGGLVYVSSDDGNLYAVSAQDGVMVWRTDIGDFLSREVREKLGTNTAPTGWDDMQSSPVAASEKVLVGSLDGRVYALNGRTGSIQWTFQTGEKVRATPTVQAGVVYIGSWDGKIYALEAQTGALIWARSIGGQVQTTTLATDDMLYTASRKASFVALTTRTGDLIYEFDYGKNMWVESSPVLQEGIVYIGSAGNKWVIGLDGRTGDSTTRFISKTYFMSTPAIGDDTFFVGGVTFRHEDKGGLFALKLVEGNFADPYHAYWYLPVEESLEAEGNWSGVMSSPVVEDAILYFGGLDGKLYAVALEP